MADQISPSLHQQIVNDYQAEVEGLKRTILEYERAAKVLKFEDGQLEVLTANRHHVVLQFTSKALGMVGQTWRFDRTQRLG